ncbi:hypothetical protein D3C73_1236440 [compost metagenome]
MSPRRTCLDTCSLMLPAEPSEPAAALVMEMALNPEPLTGSWAFSSDVNLCASWEDPSLPAAKTLPPRNLTRASSSPHSASREDSRRSAATAGPISPKCPKTTSTACLLAFVSVARIA